MCHFYLQYPPPHKHFGPWDVEWLLSLLGSWAPASSLTNFKLAWKTITLSALVTAKHCSHPKPWQLVFPWCPSCRWVTGAELLQQLDTIFLSI